MNINRAGKQTKAYWRAEQRHREKWEAETPQTPDAKAYGAYQIANERNQGFAAGWIAGVAWAKRQLRRPNKTNLLRSEAE